MRKILLSLLFVVVAGSSFAQPAGSTPDFSCPNNKLFGPKLFSDICWRCIFPIRICGGVTIKGPDGNRRVPAEASSQAICSCPDPLGVPIVGCSAGYYAHSKLIDITRQAYCAPSMGGIKLQSDTVEQYGGIKKSSGGNDKTFLNYIYYHFPLNYMLQLAVSARCGSDGFQEFDIGYLSPLDPTWGDDEMAFFLNLEVVVLANPIAQAACIADATATAAGLQPIEKLFWCAGSWGSVYPFTGNIQYGTSPVRESSLLATRALAALHRRGLATKTVGHEAQCRNLVYPTLPKTQYKMGMFYPLAEASSDHYIGESTFRWGEYRNIPGTGEDFTYVISRYEQCCITP